MRVRDWGIGSCFFWNSFFFYWSSCLSVIELVVYQLLNQLFSSYWTSCLSVIEPVSFFYWTNFFFYSYKNQKKPLAVFIINTKSLWKVSIIWYLSRKKDDTCRGKITFRWYLSRKNLKWALFSENRNAIRKPRNVHSVIWRNKKFFQLQS